MAPRAALLLPLLPALVVSEKAIIDAIFTYGSPATASPALENLQDPNGCFSGLRTYREHTYGVKDEWDAEDAAAAFNPHSHAKQPLLILHKDRDSTFIDCPCSEDEVHQPDMSKPLRVVDWIMHNSYHGYMKSFYSLSINGDSGASTKGAEPFRSAAFYNGFAFCSYQEIPFIKDIINKYIPGYVLVDKVDSHSQGQTDPILVVQFQHPPVDKKDEINDCNIVIAGTNSALELTSNTAYIGKPFCGFPNVHSGYADKLRCIANDVWPRVTSALSKCKRVKCLGHSMGGALCEMLAACVNSKRHGDPDYELLSWEKEEVEVLPEVPCPEGSKPLQV